MRILVLANQNWGKLCIEELIRNGEKVIGIITDESPLEINWYASMWEVGQKHNLPVRHSKNIKEEVDQVLAFNPDLIVSIGFRQILSAAIIRAASQGCINLHGSLLPKYRGHAPLNWAIIKGEPETGVTLHYINEGVDTGDIILQEAVSITEQDTAITVYEKTLPLYPKLLLEAVTLIKNNQVQRKPQHPHEGFYCCRRYPKDSQIEWKEQSAREVYNFVRALTGPYPTAFTFLGEKKVFITQTSLPEKKYYGPAGRVGYKLGEKVIVICKDQGIQVERIKLEENGPEIPPGSVLSSGNDFNYKDIIVFV